MCQIPSYVPSKHASSSSSQQQCSVILCFIISVFHTRLSYITYNKLDVLIQKLTYSLSNLCCTNTFYKGVQLEKRGLILCCRVFGVDNVILVPSSSRTDKLLRIRSVDPTWHTLTLFHSSFSAPFWYVLNQKISLNINRIVLVLIF